jgi:copper chaperone
MKSIELEITGMTCGHCVGAIAKALLGVNGVVHADVSISRNHAHVEHDGSSSVGSLVQAVEDEGYLAWVANAESGT